MSEIYEIESVTWYSQVRDADLTARIGRMFTRSRTSKLFRVLSGEIGDASVRVTNGVAICQSSVCDSEFINQHICDHARAVRALIN